ncbi:hypothetical protein [Sporosarcina sp. G11-34]|uniref:hypothetical protein n=1 Tax=Sporosarcina sp. G11-34 TaxID=2849605 RepID=UPI0022A93E83|nr:hypothetical protein [Sporosarcina sp. G11-34]MCZ2259574.1 hypothetical protein [Sporosarcina sp. G11-34]
MLQNDENRHVFMAIAIVILVTSPVFILLFPPFIANTLYHTGADWHILVPGVAYLFYGIAFLFLALTPGIIFILDMTKKSIVLGVIFLLLSGISFFIASVPYISLTNDGISYRTIFSTEKHTHLWDDIDKANYYEVPSEEGFSKYEFFFKDGTSIELPENGHISLLRGQIRLKVPVK